MIPLTLRGMQGALRRPVRSSARSFFALPSVLALLALVLFPVLAHAESSSGTVYKVEGEVPSIESKGSTEKSAAEKSATHPKSSNNPAAEGSAVKNGGSESSEGPEGKGEGESEESQKSSGGGGGTGGGNGNPPKGGGGEGGGSKSGGTSNPQNGISEAKELPKTQSGANISESSGGSSPVVPILIAVIVLAAISIGVVLYRQRKSGEGPDRRVSSPDAG
jgi:cobalamin biosynthesis Mg chelatase CobN